MKPQGKVTIFMIVMIVMLSIYYFALPNNSDKNTTTTKDKGQQVVKSEEFEQLRAELSDKRHDMIVSLQGVLAQADVDIEQKNNVIETIQQIHLLSQNEALLETKLINTMGYSDVFVEAADNVISVSVYIDTLSIEEVNDIILMTKTEFGNNVEVIVSYSITNVN
mgnify:FL=1|jgi:hypothetical protein